MYLTLAVHSPKPEHVEEFLAFMRKVVEAMQGTPGLLALESYRESEGRLVAIGRWESAQAFQAAVPRLMGVGGRDPAWSAAPDQLLLLQEA